MHNAKTTGTLENFHGDTKNTACLGSRADSDSQYFFMRSILKNTAFLDNRDIFLTKTSQIFSQTLTGGGVPKITGR